MPFLLLALFGGLALVLPGFARARAASLADDTSGPSPGLDAGTSQQLPDPGTSINAELDNTLDLFGMAPATDAELNTSAFLSMIAASEGADYRTLFGDRPGSPSLVSLAEHPHQRVTRTLNGKSITSTAAGRYQFLSETWDTTARKLGLVDFSPASQDAAALELIRSHGALGDVQAGRFDLAISKLRRVWASLPGAGYGQPENSIALLRSIYQQNGGVLA